MKIKNEKRLFFEAALSLVILLNLQETSIYVPNVTNVLEFPNQNAPMNLKIVQEVD